MGYGLLDPKTDFIFKKIFGSNKNKTTLNRTVCINILNFDYLKNNKFHSKFRLKDTKTGNELCDIIEIHFIEIPKLDDNSEEKDLLSAWVAFLKNPESEKIRKLEYDIKEIKSAKDELIKISADKKQRALYDMRQKAIHDEANALMSAKEQGKEEGREQAKIELVLKQLKRKFKSLPSEYEDKIKKLSVEKLDEIVLDIFDIELVEELNKYFN